MTEEHNLSPRGLQKGGNCGLGKKAKEGKKGEK